MKCNEYGDTCHDAEWCQQGGSCDAARGQGRENEQSPSRLILGVPVCALLTGGTVMAIIAAVQGSLWWLMLPVVAALGLALILGRPYRRDQQLAQVMALNELPDTDAVDPSYLDLSKCVCQWDDPRWACDLERDTGLEEGERR